MEGHSVCVCACNLSAGFCLGCVCDGIVCDEIERSADASMTYGLVSRCLRDVGGLSMLLRNSKKDISVSTYGTLSFPLGAMGIEALASVWDVSKV